ncbi:MAG TPA: M20/M25/M40 family metallo-hydrolase [Anaerolineaceae bacterium]
MRELIAEAWRPLCDELRVSQVGSLFALCRGSGPEPRPRILLAAHMDAIGMIVTQVDQGYLRFTEIGGLDPRVLPGQRVTVHGRKDLVGVVVAPADRLLPPGSADRSVPREHLLVDLGLTPEKTARLVRPGDLISFAQLPIELAGEALAGHSLDNRASVAALTVCLAELQTRVHASDIWVVATTQEEETFAGAQTAAFELQPDLAIAVDVTFAKGPGEDHYDTFPLNKGVAIGFGPNIHPGIFRQFKKIADEVEIPYQLEVMPRHSGTDAVAMQVAAEGIPSQVLGIPLRYMHTPVEEVGLKDISRAGRLLAELISRLPADFLSSLSLDGQP